MNEEELADLVSNHFPNLYTDWVPSPPPPPPPLQSIPPSARFTNDNYIILYHTKTIEDFTFDFRGKIRAQLPESAQSLGIFKSLHATKWY